MQERDVRVHRRRGPTYHPTTPEADMILEGQSQIIEPIQSFGRIKAVSNLKIISGGPQKPILQWS